MIMSFFSWGLIAFVISFSVNNMFVRYFDISLYQLSVSWAPLIEELFKALPLIYFLMKTKKTEFPILYCAMASGIGFSLQENYLYIINNSIGISGSLVFYIVLRSITTCLMHCMTTAIIGYGIQIIRKSRIMMLPLLFGLFSLSVTIHALYNLYINSSIKLIGMAIPILLYLLGILIQLPEEEPDEMLKKTK